ncbi:MAG: carboxypeptidase regulatory-like domain-containing protein [Sedimentisphaerales bacterium]|nr:carboxypeptidase regulatory-like domain-containing protein [Sedimentisphaerales bacterium]
MQRHFTICLILAIILAIAGAAYGGSITGTVTDSNGAGIPELTVQVYEYPPEDDDELTSVLTDSSGNYTISDLPAGQYMVAAFPGLTSLYYINEIYNDTLMYMEATPVTVTTSGTMSGINFQLAPSGVITGTVTDSTTGLPIEGIWIYADNYDDEEAMFSDALTDADGVYRMTGLPPADYRLDTDCEDTELNYARQYYNNATSEADADRVPLTGTATVTGIDFVLSPGGAVSGTVTDSIGQPIEGVEIEAMDYSNENWFGEAETDADGSYTLRGLSSGTYRIRACASCAGMPYVDIFYDNANWDDADPVPVVIGETTTGIDFVLSQGTSISGTVCGWDDDSGSYLPISGAEVSGENLTTGSCCGWARTESDGTYTMSGISPGSYRVRASADTYSQEFYPDSIDWGGAQAVLATVDAPATGIDFQLDLGGQIAGTILDEDTGLPITDNVWINAQPATGEPWGTGTNEIEANGSFVITGLPSGSYKICADADGYDQEFYNETSDWMMAELVDVEVGQTTSGINLTLKKEAGGRIVGLVTMADGTPIGNANVNANSMEHMKNKWCQTDNDGAFTLTGINTGNWRLRVQPPFGEEFINLSESDETIITLPEGVSEVNDIHVILPAVNLIGQVKLPDGQAATWAPVNIEKTDMSFFAFTNTDQSGYFRKGGLTVGTYRIRLEVPWGTSGIVRPDPCTIEITDTNVVLDVGILTYATAAKHITGSVQLLGGEPVGGVQVNCWRRGAEGWANTQTDSNGQFTLDVASGTWEVMIHPSQQQEEQGADWVYTGYPEVVVFADDSSEETKTITFSVQSAFSRITGRVIGPADEILRQGAGCIDIRNDSGMGNGMPIGEGGQFNIAVTAGTYNVWVNVDKQTYPYWSSPRLNPVTVADDQTVNLGDIQLVTKNSGIQGQVTRATDGAPISGVRVNAWQQQGGWTDTTTNEQGNYQLSLLAGTWDVSAEVPYDSDYVSGQPPRTIVVADSQIVTDVNFQLVPAGGSIALSLKDSDGALLTDIDNGWAYAREGEFSMQPIGGSPVSNGQATIKLPAGTFIIGVCLPPNTGYTMPGEQSVTVEQSRVEFSITLLTNNSAIAGTFYTDAAKTSPATGIQGEVFAMQKMGGVWQSTQINSSDGSYQLRVAPGEWNLGYNIRTSGYINNPPPDSRVTVESGETEQYDFVLIGADATIQGRVLAPEPSGSALNHAWVWAHSEGDGTPGSRIDNGSEAMEPNGQFSISVPSGRTYEVGSNAPSNWGYIQPDFISVTPSTGQTVTVTLQYKQSDASITGNVYYNDGGTNVPCEWAWVNAWSDNGQHAGAGADEDGNFQMNVTRGTTWHLEAFYHPREERTFYKSQTPVNVTVSSSSNTANIEVEQSDRDMPPAISAMFDPNVGWTNTLEDGTRIEIPGGAIPADGNVCISFTPMVDELQRTATDKPVGWGYAISITEQATGDPITGNFNTNVLITFSYRDQDLADANLTEDDISPAYYSTTTDSWTKVESFTVDKDANTVTVQVNHFSTWALTGKTDVQADTDTQEIEMTITKCKVKAGKTQGQDSLDASGTFAESPPDFIGITSIDVNIISLTDGNEIYTESIAFDESNVVNGRFKYTYKLVRGAPGAITALTIDFTNKTFTIKSKNIDLTGLACNLQLNVTIGDYMLSGVADETIVNGANKQIPIRLMRTYEDTLRIKSAKAKAGATDSFTVKGEIAVETVDSTDLADEVMTLTWGDQTFTIPAASFVQTSAARKSYKCSKIALSEGGIANGKFDLDKCTFNITVKNAALDVTTGAVEFGISFDTFNETAGLNLP